MDFSEIFEDKTKYGTKLKTDEYEEQGKYLIVDQGQELIAGYTDKKDGFFSELPAIIFGDHTRILKYIDQPFYIGADGVKILRCKLQNANYRYLFYALKNVYIPNTGYNRHFKWLKQSSIKYPDSVTQNRIVKILDTVSGIIQLRKKELNQLDYLIKSRFIELFENVENKIPLNSLCDVSGGYSFKSSDITSDGVVKILQIGNVYLDDVNWETTNYLPEGYVDRYSRFLLNEGDIVVALTRPIIQSLGNVKACIVKDSDMPCLLNQRVGRIVPKKNIEVNLKFIYGCLMTDSFTRYVESCCIGCSQPNISTKDIENYMVPDVSFKEQMEFVNFKEQADKSKLIIQKSLDELETLNKALMQKYFGGNGV